jgi:hypothetical protein
LENINFFKKSQYNNNKMNILFDDKSIFINLDIEIEIKIKIIEFIQNLIKNNEIFNLIFLSNEIKIFNVISHLLIFYDNKNILNDFNIIQNEKFEFEKINLKLSIICFFSKFFSLNIENIKIFKNDSLILLKKLILMIKKEYDKIEILKNIFNFQNYNDHFINNSIFNETIENKNENKNDNKNDYFINNFSNNSILNESIENKNENLEIKNKRKKLINDSLLLFLTLGNQVDLNNNFDQVLSDYESVLYHFLKFNGSCQKISKFKIIQMIEEKILTL